MAATRTWVKMFGTGAVLCIGGPALVMWVSPSEEELFKKYNPELQRKSLANRERTQQDWDSYVNQLKDYSRSDKNMWLAQKEAEDRSRALRAERLRAERDAIAKEMKAQQR